MTLQIGLALGALCAAAAASAAVVLLRKRKSPEDREARRRETVREQGRMIEGYVTGFERGFVQYSYHWRSVQYEASQDVSDLLGGDMPGGSFSGPVTVKFLSSRPSNSIVIASGWSGIPNLLPAAPPRLARPTPLPE